MLELRDVLRQAIHAPTLAELEARLDAAGPWEEILDACVDAGLVRCIWQGADFHGDRYVLAPRGRRLLRLGAASAAAA